MDQNMVFSGFPEYVAQHVGISDQEPRPAAGVDTCVNDDFNFDVVSRGLVPSDFQARMLQDAFSADHEHNATTHLYKNKESFPAAEDKLPYVSSPSSKCCLNIKPQDTLNGIENLTPGRSCIFSAIEILENLHVPLLACLSASRETSVRINPQTRTAGSVLKINRDSILRVSAMLKCPCSVSSQVQLILIVICGKIMVWYRAMLPIGYECHENSSKAWLMLKSIENQRNDKEDQNERVVHQPITIGEYHLDFGLESSIRTQVIVNELKQLETVIETLSKRMQEAGSSSISTAAAANRDFFQAIWHL